MWASPLNPYTEKWAEGDTMGKQNPQAAAGGHGITAIPSSSYTLCVYKITKPCSVCFIALRCMFLALPSISCNAICEYTIGNVHMLLGHSYILLERKRQAIAHSLVKPLPLGCDTAVVLSKIEANGMNQSSLSLQPRCTDNTAANFWLTEKAWLSDGGAGGHPGSKHSVSCMHLRWSPALCLKP